ncbi:uncharacterized protein LOC130955425 [Arachis stenosperma]|uniref:uncharacterized protein LOC130955425 n=1 Tax=Arachis stenosperma TaxID=217475 RepID=UPI0025ABCF11|nr:uncharacterized protein LOC130955425 [Arachis stenosperma]
MEVADEILSKVHEETKISYKASLLSTPGISTEDHSFLTNEIEEDTPNPEDRWYMEEGGPSEGEKPFDPCPVIPISKEEFNEWCKPWKAALIVKVLGKRVHQGFIEQRLNRDWVKKGRINIIDMDRDYFLVHFSDEEDYTHALLGGPWMIAGHYLIVQRWRLFFLSSESAVRKIAAWIRIPNLPIELYNHHFLWRVGSTIGNMLKIDKTTSIQSRGKFARICVEIDLSKKLVPRISVMENILNIEYEGLHLICFSCGKYGHRADQCSEGVATKDAQPRTGVSGEPTVDMESHDLCDNQGMKESQDNNSRLNQDPPDFGPWMMVRRQVRKKQERISSNLTKSVPSNNNLLIVEDATDDIRQKVEGRSRNPETELKEKEILNRMREIEKQQWEAFDMTKRVNVLFEDNIAKSEFMCDHSSKRPLSVKMKGKNVEVESPKKPPDLSTGVPGAGGKGFPTLIRDLRRNYEAHLIILLETHISGDRGKIIRNKIGFDSCCVEEARGHSGGIWVLWDFHYWKVEAIQQHIQFIHLKIEGRDSMPWMLTAIYRSPQRLMRKSLWDNLRDLRNSVDLPWCTIGDFNAILHSYEKKGRSSFSKW